MHTSGQASKKKAYYSNTLLKCDYERKETYAPRNKECLMIQSALRVSYTSPKVMHWVTDLVLWLFEHDEVALLTNEAEDIAALATKENFLDGKDYKLGVTTPHIVFNFLDYLLWKNNKTNTAILNSNSVTLLNTGIHKIHLTVLLIHGMIKIHSEICVSFLEVSIQSFQTFHQSQR